MNITNNISNLHFNRKDISLNSCNNKDSVKEEVAKITQNYSCSNNLENKEFDSICKHLNEESITDEEFYQNDEFEYDAADQEIDIESSLTPSMLISKQKCCVNPRDIIIPQNI